MITEKHWPLPTYWWPSAHLRKWFTSGYMRHKRPSVEPWKRWFLFQTLLCSYPEAQNCCSHFFTSQKTKQSLSQKQSQRISETRILSYDWTTADLMPYIWNFNQLCGLNKLFNVVSTAWLRSFSFGWINQIWYFIEGKSADIVNIYPIENWLKKSQIHGIVSKD